MGMQVDRPRARSLGVRLFGVWLVGSVTNVVLLGLLTVAGLMAFVGAQPLVTVLLTACVQVAVLAASIVALVVRYTPRAGGPDNGVDQALYGIGVVVVGHLVAWVVVSLFEDLPAGFLLAAGLPFVLAAVLFAMPSAISAIRGRWAG